jgi:transposase
MPKFKPYNQNQLTLLPTDIRSCIPTDHQCFAINDIIDSLDLKIIEQTYSDQGCPAYNPKMLIKLLFFSYVRGIRSSRKIEELAMENIVYRYLTANQQPDHGTISLFRKNHLDGLETVFAQLVILCDGLQMIDPTDISIDGSIFKANASKKVTYDQEDLTRLKKKIRNILDEATKIDEQEDQKYGQDHGYNELPAKIKDPKTRQAEIDRLIDKLKKLEVAEQVINDKQQMAKTAEEKQYSRNTNHNITDQEARLMKVKHGKSYQPAYNGQLATSQQVIIAYDITDENIDTKQLIPMISKSENNTGQLVKVVKADAAYFSKTNIGQINSKKIDAYIPDNQKALEERQARNNEIPKYDRRNFTYDSVLDRYLCPEKQPLIFKKQDRQGVRKYHCQTCGSCPVKVNCTKAQQRQIQVDPKFENYKTTMRLKLNSEQGKSKYLERMSDVEPVFGNILHNQGARYFLCRGKPMVKKEFGLSCIAHNLVKIVNWIKINKKNIKDLQLNTLMRLPTVA